MDRNSTCIPATLWRSFLEFHELATNACKYGALTSPAGRIEIVWKADMQERGRAVQLTWSERGGPPVTPPTRRGFGSTLIQRALAMDLDGDVQLELDPNEVRCSIAFTIEEERNEPNELH